MKEEILLGEIFNTLKKKIGQILMWSLLGLFIASVITFFFVTPIYQSTSKIVVNQTQNASQSITNTDIQTNLSLINTYQTIIKEPIILESAIQNVGSDLSVNELKDKIIIKTEDNSLVFGIAVTDENPFIAAELANAISNTFQQKIGDILDVESVTILSTAIPNTEPISPNIALNVASGILAGLVIGVGLVFLSEMTNKTVRDDKFIESLGWTNLGSVLEMTRDEISSTRISSINLASKTTGSRISKKRI